MRNSDQPFGDASFQAQLKEMLDDISAYIDGLSGEQKGEALTQLEELLDRDRREHPRVPCSIPVTCKTEGGVFKDFIGDISAGGAFIQTSETFSHGEHITLSLSFPDLKEPLKITGEVVWRAKQGIGVRFASPLSKDLKEIAGLL
jgi:uncharacterized protein (TIGR02266 family)